ncbi:MAG: hypothetical protein ACRDYY_16810, partial [Acidimicrobiales bacterium]
SNGVVAMTDGRSVESARRRDRERPRAATAPTQVHPILQLQGQVGNRAVAALLQRSGGGVPGRRPVGSPAATALLGPPGERDEGPAGGSGPLPVQRILGGGAGQEAPPSDDEARIAEEVNAQVGALPDLDEAPLVAPGNVEVARQEAGAVEDDLAPLGLARSGAFAEWYRGELGGQGYHNAVAPVAKELAGARGDVDLPAPPRPGFFSRAKTSVQSLFSSIGSGLSKAGAAIKGAFSRENRRDIGAKAPVGGSVGSATGTHLSMAIGAGRSIVDNSVTSGSAKLVGGAGAVGKVHEVGGQMGQVAGGAASTSPTLEHPGNFAHSFASGAFELTHQIASVVGIFFSALKAAMDLRSLVSSIRVIRGLKAARRRAVSSGASEAVVAAVDYAISQKYEKVIKRAVGAASALAALGVALAILISNPAGAALAAIIIGGVGASVFLYKVGRWAWKKWKTESLGKKRKEIAQRLYNQIRARDALALDAVRALHLEPETVIAAPNGPDLIARKLKSS